VSATSWALLHRRALFAAASVLVLTGASWATLAELRSAPPVEAARVPNGPLRLESAGADVLADRDHDGLPDVQENFVYGSDPLRPSTTGGGVPDGWLARYGFDPTQPGVERTEAAAPPADKVPEVYGGSWPQAYHWTLTDVYGAGKPAAWNESRDGPWQNGVDPTQWQAPSGLPYGWLHHYGLSLNESSLAAQVLEPGALPVADAFQHGTDPRRADGDLDGLPDRDELDTYRTDPRNPSTGGTGAPDGWLVHYGLDPKDPTLGAQDPAHKGMGVLETYRYDALRFGAEAALHGAGLDPTRTSTLGGPIPDGWLVRHGLDPLDRGVGERVVARASEFANVRNLTEAPAGLAPLPDLALRVRDCYAYGRPAGWDESKQGPWNGGLDPASKDTDGDGLPDVVEVRGWYAIRYVGLGPSPQRQPYLATADPLSPDTDGDGLTDGEEYDGQAVRDGATTRWAPSDPRAADTAFSGLSDGEKVLGVHAGAAVLDLSTTQDGVRRPLLDPVRMDTGGAYLADGDGVAYWQHLADTVNDPYPTRFPGSHHERTVDWMAKLPRFKGVPPTAAQAAALLGPGGDLAGTHVPNVVNPDVDGDGIPNGMEIDPGLLRLGDFPTDGPRAPTDPANPDTDADGLADGWELRYGQYDTAPPVHWDLDAAQWSSDPEHPDVGDGDRNLDGDVVAWSAYKGAPGARVRVDNTFVFTNRLQELAKADPRVADQNHDGVTEGWAYFWGQEYPARLDAGDPAVGTLVPAKDEAFLQRATGLSDVLKDVGSTVRSQLPRTGTYTRIVELAPTDDPAFFLNPANSEAYAAPASGHTNPEKVDVLRDGQPAKALLGTIRGTYRETYGKDQVLGLNPYLPDTDGDGLDDAWEAGLGTCEGTLAADPRNPGDAAADPDKDGLGNKAELTLGTSPCLADSDLGGVPDGQESALGSAPLAPADDLNSQSNRDIDGDLVRDFDEIRAGIPTNPADADTDHDGLLDGADQTLFHPTGDATIAAFLAEGIAHRTQPNQGIQFYGEADVAGADPTRWDSLVPGVADGWVVYHNLVSGGGYNTGLLLAGYSCHRPAWWDETRLGAWWWGVKPTPAVDCGRDLDRDGLDDVNGADPVAGASHLNAPDPAGTLPDLLQTLAGLQLVEAGQAWGECAGDPIPCRTSASAPGAQAAVQFQGVSLGLPEGGTLLEKEAQFPVAGKLQCAQAACATLANRVIVAHLANREPSAAPLGVGLTGADGSFSFQACLCAAGSFTIPPNLADVVVLNRTSGTVGWTVPVAGLPAGAPAGVSLTAYATTTTATASHPQYGTFGGAHATAQATVTPAAVHLSSGTALKAVTVPAFVPWKAGARQFTPVVLLQDASGTAVAGQPVRLAFGADARDVQTDGQGHASWGFAVPDQADPVPFSAHYGGDPNLHYEPPTADLTRSIVLQAPLTLALKDTSDIAEAGRAYDVTVVATSGGLPVAGLPVRASLGILARDAVTDAKGEAHASLAIGPQPPGDAPLAATFTGSPSYAAASVGRTVHIRTGSLLSFTVLDGASAQDGIRVLGSLRLDDGDPIAQADVHASLDGAALAETLVTGPDGSLEGTVTPATGTRAGIHTLQLSYGGEAGEVGPSSATAQVRLVVRSLLAVGSVSAGRGTLATVTGTLTDAFGTGVRGQVVALSTDLGANRTAVTGADGGFQASWTVPTDAALGPHPVRAVFAGSENGVYGNVTRSGIVQVATPALLEVSVAPALHLGPNDVVGRLASPEGEPLPDAPVEVRLANQTVPARTGLDGRFRAEVTLGRELPPGSYTITVHAGAGGDRGAAETSLERPLRLATHIEVSLPGEAGRGDSIDGRFALLDESGRPVAGHEVELSWRGESARVTTGPDGIVPFTLDVPADAQLGDTPLRATSPGDAYLTAAAAERAVRVKDGARITFEGLPGSVTAGGQVRFQVRVLDGAGRPVGGVPIGIQPARGGLTVVADTNATGVASFVLAAPAQGAFQVLARFAGTPELALQTEASVAVPVAGAFPWLAVGLGAGLLAVGGAAVAASMLVARRRLRGRDEAARILGEAYQRVVAGDSWTGAVVLAYNNLATFLAHKGFPERPGETAREFVSHLVHATAIPPESAVALVQLFERARYGGAPMDRAHAREARNALREVLTALRSHLKDAEAVA